MVSGLILVPYILIIKFLLSRNCMLTLHEFFIFSGSRTAVSFIKRRTAMDGSNIRGL